MTRQGRGIAPRSKDLPMTDVLEMVTKAPSDIYRSENGLIVVGKGLGPEMQLHGIHAVRMLNEPLYNGINTRVVAYFPVREKDKITTEARIYDIANYENLRMNLVTVACLPATFLNQAEAPLSNMSLALEDEEMGIASTRIFDMEVADPSEMDIKNKKRHIEEGLRLNGIMDALFPEEWKTDEVVEALSRATQWDRSKNYQFLEQLKKVRMKRSVDGKDAIPFFDSAFYKK